MMHPIETFEVNGLTVKIYPDSEVESPRNWDNLGTLVCFSKNWNDLGDGGFSNRAHLMRHVMESGAAWVPVIYHHHGYHASLSLDIPDMVRQKLVLSTLPDDATDDDIESVLWCKDQCGVIFIESEKLIKEFGADNAETRIQAFKAFESEIETYNQYLSGEVYGYQIERPKTCDSCAHTEMESVDSCWGFYGIEYCKEEALSIAEHAAKELNQSPKTNPSTNPCPK